MWDTGSANDTRAGSSRILSGWAILVIAIAAGILVCVLLAHAYIGYFTRYIADDFYTAAVLRDRGVIGSQIYWYIRWTGRFSFTLAVNIIELLGPWIVSYLPGLALGAWLLVLSWAIHQFGVTQHWRHPRAIAFIIALLMMFATIDGLPYLYQDIYWQTGIMTYLAPLISLAFLVGLLLRFERRRADDPPAASLRRDSAVQVVLTFALALFTGGFSDTSVILLLAFFLLAIFSHALGLWGYRHRTTIAVMLSGFSGAIVALIILVAAPGNARRLAFYPPQPSLDRLLHLSIVGAWEFVVHWVANQTTTILLAVSILFFICWQLRSNPKIPNAGVGVFRRWAPLGLVTVPVVAFVLIAGCFAPAVWGMSKLPPGRALLVPQFALAGFTLIWLWFAASLLQQFLGARHTGSKPVTLALTLLISVALLLGPVPSIRKTLALLPAARQYADQWDQRDRLLRAARLRGETDVVAPVLGSISGLEELVPDTENWVNRVTADYYGFKTLRTP